MYTVENSQSSLLILGSDFVKHKSDFQKEFASSDSHKDVIIHDYEAPSSESNLPQFTDSLDVSRRALIIYTSGTTSRPKGCVSTHANITFQASSLIKAWKYSPDDKLIHVLPLHHIHGIINGLTATLMVGGTVEMYPKFDAASVWKRWADGDTTMFMVRNINKHSRRFILHILKAR